MIEINLAKVDVNLVIDPDTRLRTLRFIDAQSGLIVRVDFEEEHAHKFAAALSGSSLVLAPADAMPKAKVQH
jgi:PleD family two-component response regulator